MLSSCYRCFTALRFYTLKRHFFHTVINRRCRYIDVAKQLMTHFWKGREVSGWKSIGSIESLQREVEHGVMCSCVGAACPQLTFFFFFLKKSSFFIAVRQEGCKVVKLVEGELKYLHDLLNTGEGCTFCNHGQQVSLLLHSSYLAICLSPPPFKSK